MSATPGTTTLEVPLHLRARLAALKQHPRQPFHEVISRALEALEGRTGQRGLDRLVTDKRQALRRAAKNNGIDRLWLFGSRAKGLARPDSDVDLLYHAPKSTNLWHVAGFYADAEEILGRPLSLVDIEHLPKRLEHVMAEAVPI